MNILAIIPARGNSKEFPRKNLALLDGRPLIWYTIMHANESKFINRVIVSTEDDETKQIAMEFGAETPFTRPEELSDDNATTEAVLKYAIEWLEENENYKPDVVVLLEATYPIRRKGLIDEAISKFLNECLDTVFVSAEDSEYHWKKKNGTFVRVIHEDYIPRQKREPLYLEGSVYVTKPEIIKQGRRVGKKIGTVEAGEGGMIDIHTEFDIWMAERILKEWKK